ncbi:isocitrate lyase/PEP mutase family protein [Streptomyces sp. NRRL S-481]|uniref:isocitrate lyase/PEP mutase family protein n=1 Tax=Streptomyces sp. NRRL S-481 TaxID=1463911 RepID=UPI0004C8FF77|nr:isocitrate lyase/phosphoenolpyruvate mutase family protein [Streptomyces sp. NRRL S-481]
MSAHPKQRQTVGTATTFADLHRADEPLLLPNAWDCASARILAARGYRAIATTSLGVAAVAGLPDAVAATREETLRLAFALGSGPFLLSVDAEEGFSEDADEVAEFARELYAVGVAGINLEDGCGPVDRLAAKITAVKRAAPGLFVNARTDTYWRREGDAAETLARLDAYRQAGADGVFVPGLTDLRVIATLVRRLDIPLNVLYSPGGPSIAHLAEAGVRRISVGSLLYRRALGAALEAMADIGAGRTPSGAAPSYGEVAGLVPAADDGQ